MVLAIVDVVSTYWIRFLVCAETISTQVQLLFADALATQGIVQRLERLGGRYRR